MGNKASAPKSVDGKEEISAVSPQSNHSNSKQLSPKYMEGVPDPKKGSSRSKNANRRSSRDRDRGGETREDEASPSLQKTNKRISPASTDSISLSFDNKSPPASPSGRITDDQVQLDLPMADLMAYLQMVANHSSNLPLTRRDDPDLGRTVSSLTAEEYAFKCAAFIPSKIRILGGQFGKYGKVWDLPTSEVS
jgi:hypothetical protein